TAHSSPRMLELYERVAGAEGSVVRKAPAVRRRATPNLISVVVPVLNEATHLPEQLAALAAQTYRGRWEGIVSDNGSEDGTPETAASWCDRLPRLRVVDASDRKSLNHARNVGAINACGDFVAFCDGDDVVSPNWLRELAEAAPRADIVGGSLDVESLNAVS